MSPPASRGYAAFFAVLEHLYQMTHSDDLGSLLGGMSLLHDGGSADPAYKEEWDKLEKGNSPGEVIETAIAFLDVDYLRDGDYEDCKRLFRVALERRGESLIWKAWLFQLERAQRGEIDVHLTFLD